MTAGQLIDTDSYSAQLRSRAIDLAGRRLLITDFRESQQEEDLTLPPNCGGYGRIRHFRRATSSGWPENPLPIDPASHVLGLPVADGIQAQVFQNAACNWRCWYCYVPFDLLSATERRAAWFTAEQLIQRYLAEPSPPALIDLTGGQPDLVPEWIPWMMDALRTSGLEHSTYLWSDDNLSTDYYMRYLSLEMRELVSEYPTYGRVCCFKGYDPESFAFNTQAAPDLFDRQFALFKTLLSEGLDLYAYVTFTSPDRTTLNSAMPRFLDRLQAIHPNLPLRTVPLEIELYTPVGPRMNSVHQQAMRNQWSACEAWQAELERRYSSADRECAITEVRLESRVR